MHKILMAFYGMVLGCAYVCNTGATLEMFLSRFISFLVCLSVGGVGANSASGQTTSKAKRTRSRSDDLNALPAPGQAAEKKTKSQSDGLNSLRSPSAAQTRGVRSRPVDLNSLPASGPARSAAPASAAATAKVATSRSDDLNAMHPTAVVSKRPNVVQAVAGKPAQGAAQASVVRPAVAVVTEKSATTGKAVDQAPCPSLLKKSGLKNGTLFIALESALKNNKEILSHQSELRRVNESRVAASSPFLPSVSLHAGYSNGNEREWGMKRDDAQQTAEQRENNSSKVKSKKSETSGSVRIEQNIFRGGADISNLNETDLSIRSKWSSFEALKQRVLREIAVLYCEIVAKEQEIADLKALLVLREESVKVAKEMQSSGAEKPADYSQAVAGRAETEAKLAMANAELVRYKASFKELSGYELPARLGLPDGLLDVSVTLDQCLDLAVKYNHEIVAENDKLDAARAAVGKPNGKLLPSVNLTCSFDRSHDGGKKDERARRNTDRSGHTIGLNVTVPIYDGGVGRSEARQAIEVVSQVTAEREKKIGDVKTELTSTWWLMNAAKSSMASALKAVEAREMAFRNTQDERKAGTKIMNDELKAQQELFDAKLSRTNAAKDIIKSQCSILALTGYFSAERLGIKDGGCDERAHYSGVRWRV